LFIDSAGVITTDNGFASGRLNVVNTNTVATFDRMLLLRSSNLSNAFLGLGSDSFYVASASTAPIVFCTNSDGGTSGSSVPTNERLRITSAGLVGIGTSAPTEALTVNGRVQSQWNAFANGGTTSYSGDAASLVTGSTAGMWAARSDSALLFAIGSNEKARIDSSGRLGINTASPNSVLQVNSGTNLGGILIGFNAGSSNFYDADLQVFRTGNGTERARIDSSGRLGIGSSAPQAKLHISDLTASAVELVRLQSNLVSPSGNKSITWADATDVVGRISLDYTSPTAKMRFGSLYNSGYQTSDLMTLTPTGLGIGSSAPDAQLKVAAAGATLFIGFDGNKNIFDASDNIFRSHAGSERARIDSSGRLLVGTSSSFSAGGSAQYGKFQVVANSFSALTQGIVAIARGQAAGASITSGSAIGTLVFSDNTGGEFAQIACEADAATGTNDYPGRLTFSTTADGASSPTERMRIGNGGDFYFRTTNSDPAFNRVNGIYITQNSQLLCRVNGGSGWDLGASTSTPIHISFYTDNGSARVAAGNISSNGSTTTYSATSDYRLKENINLLTAATKRVLDLRPVTFDWKEGLGGTQPQGEGFIAHEVQAVCPLAVTGEKDAVDEKGNPKYQGVDPAKLVALLTAALQEAIGEIESLKARVAALESA
jgi:hypothetical protein